MTTAIGFVGLYGCFAERMPPTRSSCLANLKQIGVALHTYHEEHGMFPPAVTYDSEGRPAHSWRVLILPLMERELYDQYDFSQPWSSPHNLKLSDRMPDVYRCPNIDESATRKTPIVAIVGEEAAWAKSGSRNKKDFADGLKNTVMVLELTDRAVPWTQPEDLEFPLRKAAHGDTSQRGDGSVVNGLFADGSIYGLDKEMLGNSLRAAFTRAQKDVLDRRLLRAAVEHYP
jgi:hypothetical protein